MSAGFNEELINCPAGCGRKFNKDSLIIHYKICKDVFQQKRCVFNSQLKRVGYDYFIGNKKNLPQFSSPKSIKMKTENAQIKTPQITSKYLQVISTKRFCKGCLRDFDIKIADDHIQKCTQKLPKINGLSKLNEIY
ncbi:unnamed protein product [Paramecium octaurelia]|uniref:C2HC/C3H-type domain-containing protein n=1 Tax=Paramecium octaurelia TaxID=43137 RepID=A0A8S1T663_PAROT|nr:unnamed protein product [Paramecium octaurelia]